MYGINTKLRKHLQQLIVRCIFNFLVKINDQTRYGCIALEILSDSDFLTYFSLRGDIKGVNHIYCKYLSRHPTDP